jgi:hypothetical protein
MTLLETLVFTTIALTAISSVYLFVYRKDQFILYSFTWTYLWMTLTFAMNLLIIPFGVALYILEKFV